MADLIITGMSLTGGGITITLPPTSSVIADTYFNYTTVLLSGDGTNNATNATFLDSSTNNFTITRNGNTTQGTFSPYGANWSNYFDGTGDSLSGASNIAFEMSTGDFTVEAWVNPSALSASDARIWSYQGAGGTVLNLYILASGSGSQFAAAIRSHGNTGYTQTNGTTVAKVGTWYHVAFSRSSGTTKLFVNGVQEGSTQTSQTQNIQNAAFSIGGYSTGSSEYFTGYVSNLRVLKGTALYTASFTPSTTPLAAISGTSLLTCQSNRFIDNSTNAFAITRNGDVSVQRFSPFAPTAAYSTSTIGGSAYFDGNGDYLTLAGATPLTVTGGTSFTIETWIYPQFTGVERMIVSQDDQTTGNQGFQFRTTSSNFIQFIFWTTSSRASAVTTTTTTTFTVNVWNHVAATWDGTTLRLFINGVLGASAAASTIYSVQNNTTNIGAGRPTSTSQDFSGYITDVRLVKNTAVYTGAFTPPTTPLTAITNTSLLLNMTNAGIIDNTMINNLETVGDAKISTTQSKFGGSSMFFDGFGDYLTIPNSVNLQFGTGDFTVEFWAYVTGGSSWRAFVSKGAADTGWSVIINNTGYWAFSDTGNNYGGSVAVTNNSWTHIAFTRSGTTVKLFVNGTQALSTTLSTNFNQTEQMVIGAGRDTTIPITGYIDDLRITKGVARYTTTFTPPTAAFPTQ